jgi:large exoprotein involved in heme utilization and adhesion
LQVQDLILMRHNSTISAEARNNANGGNVTIKAPFIVAVPTEDSDIIAKAVEGRGGNINITTSGMFGLEERPQPTLYSDINASSDFGVNGTIQINTPDIDPNRGLANLATEVIDASNQIAQTCPAAGKAAQNEFFITGRGGLPPDPRDVLSSDDVFVNLVTLNPGGENRSNPIVSTNQTSVTPAPLVEAQGWVINDQGQMELTAHAHSVTPHSSRQRSSDCNAPKS